MEPAFNRRKRLMAPTSEREPRDAGCGRRRRWRSCRSACSLRPRPSHRAPRLHDVPWSTFTINATGCFLAGAAVASLVDRHDTPGWLRVGVVVGFLGAYTTFSTFSQETRDLLVEGHTGLALLNALGSTAAGVAAVVFGMGAGKAL